MAYEIFMRATFNKDVSTGLIPVYDHFSTFGPHSTWHIKNKILESPEPKCYVLQPMTCTPDTWEKVINGSVLVKDYYVVEDESTGFKPAVDGAADLLRDQIRLGP